MSLAPSLRSHRSSRVARSATVAPALVVALAIGVGCGSSNDFTAAPGPDASVASNDSGGVTSGNDGSSTVVVVAPPPTMGGQMDGGDASTIPPVTVVDAGGLSPDDCSEKADITQLFVSQTSGSATETSCQTTPCTTISAAIAAATSARKVIYIDKGTYDEQLTLKAGITLRGGWQLQANGWSPICDPSRLSSVIVMAPSTTNKTIVASDLGGAAAIEDLEILSKASAAPGESIYGIFATGATTSLTLTDVSVSVAAGGNGVDGSAGTAGDPTVCAMGDNEGEGVAGPNGASGNGASAPHYDQNGSETSAATGGTNGGAGSVGQAGSDAPTCITLSETNIPHPDKSCIPGQDPGVGCPCVSGGTMQSCAAGGAAGCGGAPGTAGGPGTDGGSSIALFAYGATVTVVRSSLSVGNGGNGGNGGAGGTGAAPQDNYAAGKGPGTPKDCRDTGTGQAEKCTCNGTNNDGAVGVAGTAGGAGGQGGTGGGGSGGDSYAYWANGTNVSAPGVTPTPGMPGMGGKGATTATNGASGQAGRSN